MYVDASTGQHPDVEVRSMQRKVRPEEDMLAARKIDEEMVDFARQIRQVGVLVVIEMWCMPMGLDLVD